MSRLRNNGGWNKSHGTAENTPRLDSFETMEECIFTAADKGNPLTLYCDRYTEYGTEADREFVELWAGEWCQTLELSQKKNGFGGSQTFFLCPACGERRRYLYLSGSAFVCRKCARLNYKSQQETRSGSMYFYHKGVDLAEKRLDAWTRACPDGFRFCTWVPERPRYMHQTTYQRYLRRFLRYREKHSDRQMQDIARLLRIFK